MTDAYNVPAPGQPADRPDWVVLGVPAADGKVAVFASKKLDHADLAIKRVGRPYLVAEGFYVAAPPRCTLTVVMPEFTMVVADTYGQAFRVLFEEWSPEPDQPALPRQLVAGGDPRP